MSLEARSKHSKPGFKLVISVPILIHFVHFASWKRVQSMTTTMAEAGEHDFGRVDCVALPAKARFRTTSHVEV